ncbi:MAG: alanine racemase [Minisyncoccia bacterium]|jgi:alanine racemase
MRTLFRKLRGLRFRYEPLIIIAVHRDRIIHNLRQFQVANPGVAIAPVLKSNAYGHGLVQVAKILDDANRNGELPFLCVDSYVEALILRNEGVRTPLLILGYTPLPNILRSALKNVSFTVTSLPELQRLSLVQRRPIVIHLKIDTGMHRQGVLLEELGEALRIVGRSEHITLEGVYSHLADADTPKSALTKAQIKRWNTAVREVREAVSVRFFHLANTAGSHYSREIDANMMRLGIGLYGINTSLDRAMDLLPALEMKTRITSVRDIKRGEYVGYNAAFKAKRAMPVATIPVGYAEGIDRRLSNRGVATVAGVLCPYVGRINMNMTSIDVSRVPHSQIDAEVLVVSAEHGAPNSVEAMAKLCGTIPYEIFIRFPAQIRRVVCP